MYVSTVIEVIAKFVNTIKIENSGWVSEYIRQKVVRNVTLKKLIRKSKGKKRNQIKHARKRFEKRFGIDLNENQYTQLVNRVKKGRAHFIRRQSNRISIWDVKFEGKKIRVVYDKKTAAIVTALYPPGYKPDTIGERSGLYDNKSNEFKELVR